MGRPPRNRRNTTAPLRTIAAVTIQYALRRDDIWRAYWFTWRNGWTLKIAQAIIAASTFYVVFAWRAGSGAASHEDVVVASLAAVASILWLPIYPLLRFKPQARTLTIAAEGIQTQIGKISRELAWSDIKRLERRGDRLYLIGRGGNSFAVPDHAFPSPADRDAFEERARTWWRSARAA